MPTCGFCSTVYKDIKNLITHMKLFHDSNELSHYKCVEENCFRNFTSLNSFKKHLKKHDYSAPLMGEKSLIPHSEITNNVHVDSDVFESNEAEFKNCSIKPDSDDANQAFFDDNNYDQFRKLIGEHSLHFISKCYANNIFTRRDVQLIMNCVCELFNEPFEMFKRFLSNLVDDSNITRPSRILIDQYLDTFQNMFKGIDTEYSRLKHFEESGYYIKPIDYIIGERLDKIHNGVGLPKTYTSQFIPLNMVLKKVFELPSVYTETMENIRKLDFETTISNIIQTQFWKSKVQTISCDQNIILPLFIYFDEYESGNSLGSHAGIHKIGAIYYSVPCIPTKFMARLENIFLAMLFHSSDLKEFGGNVIFKKLIEELTSLQSHGISIDTNEGTKTIYFSICFFLGDTLGLNMILGFTESFRANYYCRFCKSNRSEMQTNCMQIDEKLRTKTNYEDDLQIDNITLTGIKEVCIWNEIPSFHVTENFSVDIAHDIFEGVVLFDFIEIFHQFVFVYYINRHIEFTFEVF